jgi:hypothetical protein
LAQGGDGDSGSGAVRSWARPRDAALIKAVSDLGAGDWGAVAAAVNAKMLAVAPTNESPTDAPRRHEQKDMTAAAAKQRWDELAPLLKTELSDPTLERDCGHSCGTCPTRSQCHLHEVLEIEDMVLPKRHA